LVVNFGILGMFLFGLVVAIGSFVLFGCQCINNADVYHDPVLQNKAVPSLPPSEISPVPSAPRSTAPEIKP
jgi:hypothetical protein